MEIWIFDKRPGNKLSIDKEMLGEVKEAHTDLYHGVTTIVQDHENGFQVRVSMKHEEFLEYSKEVAAWSDKRLALQKEYNKCPKCGETISGNKKVDHFRSAHPEYRFTEERPYPPSNQKRYRCEGCGLTFGSFKILVERHTKCIGNRQ